MNKLFYYFILFISIILSSNLDIISKGYEVSIDSVYVNNEFADENYRDKIVISNTDSIIFSFSTNPKLSKEPVLFRVSLIMGRDTSVNIISGLEVRYAHLPQSNYKFKISAFDSNGNWQTTEDVIEFIVDNELSSLVNNLSNSEIQIENLKQRIKELESEDNTISIISDIALIILIVVIFVFLLIFISNRPKKKKNINNNIEATSKVVNMPSPENIDLAKENAALKEELKALRKQIDRMQSISRDLIEQNKDLQDTINLSDKSKKELEELQKQKEELFAIIVHDIKNPASVIKGLVDLLTNYDSTASDFDDIMKDIEASSSRILMLSSDVSKIMALEGTGLKLQFDKVDMNDIAQDVFHRNSYSAKNKNLTYESFFENGLPEITLDIVRIDEVMDNLISNAIKYTDKDGSILVETTFDKDKNHIIFSVSDTGQGLSEEDIKSTFQKGATLSSKPTAGESATGLGLWIVKKMIEAHNGNVWVKSKKGEGSTFAFSIPIKQKEKTTTDNDLESITT